VQRIDFSHGAGLLAEPRQRPVALCVVPGFPKYRNAIEYIVEAMQRKFASQPATSLLPTEASVITAAA
jgi:hypothetical protein